MRKITFTNATVGIPEGVCHEDDAEFSCPCWNPNYDDTHAFCRMVSDDILHDISHGNRNIRHPECPFGDGPFTVSIRTAREGEG